YAVAARDSERAKAFAEKFSAKKFYGSYLDLIRDDEVDAIYIGLPHNLHYEIAKLCVENGKAVLCEKPFFTNKKDAEALFELAAKRKCLLMEGMWTRFLPAYRKAKEWVDQGKIGQLKLIDASFSFNAPFQAEGRLFNPQLAGGALLDAGVYPIEFATGIAGEYPEKLASLSTKAPTGVDDVDVIQMRFPSGVLASLSCGISVKTSPDAHIYGTNGFVVVYNFLATKKCELYDNEGQLVESFNKEVPDGFVYEIEHFCDLYQRGCTESDLISWRNTMDCAEIFDRINADKM
ncbi:MAG: Gfo/Idh/MocA family protein, partial [Acetanaerobacterium sp.]